MYPDLLAIGKPFFKTNLNSEHHELTKQLGVNAGAPAFWLVPVSLVWLGDPNEERICDPYIPQQLSHGGD